MNSTAMRFLLFALLVAALLGTTGWFSPAAAQGARGTAGSSRGAAERAAVELRRGMSLDEVQQLLGKPARTALSGTADTGTLRWTYTALASNASSDRNLNIDFSAKAAEPWTVSGWGWSNY
jgi:outer membrane protein assembly factor BamE (lipoprotein component of BamABCDE complex)